MLRFTNSILLHIFYNFFFVKFVGRLLFKFFFALYRMYMHTLLYYVSLRKSNLCILKRINYLMVILICKDVYL